MGRKVLREDVGALLVSLDMFEDDAMVVQGFPNGAEVKLMRTGYMPKLRRVALTHNLDCGCVILFHAKRYFPTQDELDHVPDRVSFMEERIG